MSRKRIQNLKNKLASGQMSQEEAEATAGQIRNLGGKVKLGNFGYQGGVRGQGAIPTTGDVSAATTSARPIRDPGSVYEADVSGEMAESAQQIQFQNPNFSNPFGSQVTTLNPDGTVSVNQNLSPEQQAILEQGEALTQTGQQMAAHRLEDLQPFQFGSEGFEAERARIEDEVFQRLTRGMEDDYQQTRQSKEQELFNKGIPYSSDPNSRYQRELGDIDERFDEAKLQARSQAAVQGMGELTGQYGIELGTYQQGMSDLYSLSGLGTGLQLPNFQQYQGPNFDVADPSSYIYAGKELRQGNKALAQDAAIANKQLALASAASQPQAPQPPAFP